MKSVITSLIALCLLANVALAGELVNTAGASNVALNGYDTVAFFTQSEAINGSPSITAEHEGATYFFSTEEHRTLFEKAPEKYAPQFGGYCAYGVSINNLFPVDIRTWQVRDGKLYFNLNPDVLMAFNEEFEKNLANARQHWPGLVKKHAR